MELIIQKAVELGVAEIVPMATKRAVVKLDAKKAAKKIQRWNEIAKSAAKQSKRGMIPEVKSVMSVSYTHLDVYKRQALYSAQDFSESVASPSGTKVRFLSILTWSNKYVFMK